MSLEKKYYGDKREYRDPYFYEEMDVLKNVLNIKNGNALNAYERAVTSQRLLQLHIKPYEGNFDVNHYLGIHKYIFSDVYPFAGKTRTVDIIKGETYFARSIYIESSLEEVLDEMKKRLPKVESLDELASLLSTYYIDLNLIHPFREGNGRCEREFLREYVLYLNKFLPFPGVSLDYSKMNKGLLLVGTIENNDQIIKKEFEAALVSIEEVKKK